MTRDGGDFSPQSVGGVAFDLDGTLYRGDEAVEGGVELVRFLRGSGRRVFFFTNASGRTRRDIHAKLARMGYDPDPAEVYTSAYAAAVYLSRHGVARAYCLGTPALAEEVAAEGIEVTLDPSAAEAVVIGLDPSFSYDKLVPVMQLCGHRPRLIACNRDSSYPVEGGRLLPGCGPIVAAIEDALGCRAETVGKPEPFMLGLLSERTGLDAGRILVVGDSYTSDIAMAKRCGAPSILISGDSPPPGDCQCVVPRIKELFSILSL